MYLSYSSRANVFFFPQYLIHQKTPFRLVSKLCLQFLVSLYSLETSSFAFQNRKGNLLSPQGNIHIYTCVLPAPSKSVPNGSLGVTSASLGFGAPTPPGVSASSTTNSEGEGVFGRAYRSSKMDAICHIVI